MPECAMDGCARPAPDAWVCHQCGAWTANSLTEAGRLWPELPTTLARQARHGTPGPRPRGRAPAAPIRPDGEKRHYGDQTVGHAGGLVVDLAASDVGDVVRNTASTWARVISDETGADWPGTVPELLRWLAGRMEWARHQQWAVECLEELGGLARLIRRTIDAPTERCYLGPCECATDLYARRDATHVTCPGCGSRWDVSVLEDLLEREVRKHSFTAKEIEDAYGIRADRIRQWASRSRITQRGTDRHGRPLYALPEVLDLARIVDLRGSVTTNRHRGAVAEA